jgi:mediator of RNA polymerase II transcription subunit 12
VTSTSSKSDIHSSLTALVATIFLTLPNAFIASAIWSTYSAQLYEIILALPNDESGIAQTVLQTLKGDWADLNARNSASMGRGVSFYGEDGSGVEREQEFEEEELESIKVSPHLSYLDTWTDYVLQLLNLFSFPMSLSTLHKSYFHKRRRTRTLTEELSTLFIWCTTGVGRGKSYAVAALIELELADLETERAKDLQGFTTRQGAKSKASALDREKVDVERSFMDWIDRTTEWTEKGLKAVHSLLAELIRRGVLSYSLYFQRMIARGETEERGPDDGPVSPSFSSLSSRV